MAFPTSFNELKALMPFGLKDIEPFCKSWMKPVADGAVSAASAVWKDPKQAMNYSYEACKEFAGDNVYPATALIGGAVLLYAFRHSIKNGVGIGVRAAGLNSSVRHKTLAEIVAEQKRRDEGRPVMDHNERLAGLQNPIASRKKLVIVIKG